MIKTTKKRYQLALDENDVNEFRKVADSLGFPKSVMSSICNEAIKKTCAIFKKAKEKNGLTMIDLFSMIGEEVESVQEMESKTCPKCGRPMHKFHDCVLNPVSNLEGVNDAKPAQKTNGVAKVPRR